MNIQFTLNRKQPKHCFWPYCIYLLHTSANQINYRHTKAKGFLFLFSLMKNINLLTNLYLHIYTRNSHESVSIARPALTHAIRFFFFFLEKKLKKKLQNLHLKTFVNCWSQAYSISPTNIQLRLLNGKLTMYINWGGSYVYIHMYISIYYIFLFILVSLVCTYICESTLTNFKYLLH